MPGLGIGLTTKLDQTLKLSAQQRQSLAILQTTVQELRAEIQQQMMANPVIEDVVSRTERQLSTELPDDHTYAEVTEKELNFQNEGGIRETLGTGEQDDGVRDYFLNNLEGASHDEEAQSRRDRMFDSMVASETLHQHLSNQVGTSNLQERDYEAAELLIDDIDDDGYFRGSFANIAQVSGISMDRLEEVLAEIRTFDPIGCGSRNLRECWLSQMEKLDDSPWEDEIRELLLHHFDDLTARHEGVICRALGLSADEYRKVLSVLRSLDAYPGRIWSARAENGGFMPKQGNSYVQRTNPREYIKPEVFLERAKSGKWIVRVDGRDLPEIRISKRYQEMLADPNCSQDAKRFIRERIRAAEALRDAIRKRQDTIRGIAQAIIDAQPDVLTKGMSALRPLTMQQIADQVGVVGTTVSRTVRNKYIQTPFGVVELRRFFTGGVTNDDGGAVSNVAVQSRIKDIVAGEDTSNPLSDESIAKILKGEGINVARRTVAKYRKAVGIPGTADRKMSR